MKGVKKFLDSYIKSSEDFRKTFVYEGDLQAGLYNSIKSILGDDRKWNSEKIDWVVFENKENDPKTKTPCLVHCEQWCRYKHNGKNKGKHIDIAVWNTKENAAKSYLQKDLLLLIEIKYVRAKSAIKEVSKDYNKLLNLKCQRGLAITFVVPEIKVNEKLFAVGKPIGVCDIMKNKQLQALVVCKGKIVEISSQ
ncbi:MAG: hypothetical protein WAK60_05880 [Sedimentisphaerales bacterium]